MREHKYRAWDKSRGKFHDSGNLHIEVSPYGTLCWTFGNQPCEPLVGKERDNWVLMQYTGLKDKNGVEIYEGDIVNNGTRDYNERVKAQYFEVCWNEIKGYWDLRDSAVNLAQASPEERLEVVGNIYKNPDLIEGGTNE